MLYQKLVRDKIPEIIAAQGERANIRILDAEAYSQALEQKLDEEVAEFHDGKMQKNWRTFWKWCLLWRRIWAIPGKR